MYRHTELGITVYARTRRLYTLINSNEVSLAGYTKNKVYGTLSCASGKLMKAENRVFFQNEQEALKAGYRPCGNCMPEKYRQWKISSDK
ncbi:Ada metal-binding domain-containing protein [Mucilaginibacter sp. PAMB04168]|uniref:Ada metal-binding domain-containing protein n=1 Tax=Mucilaginibacter sp. PAMB04168 TaxID=3138567 RepID=UPI0031F60A1D